MAEQDKSGKSDSKKDIAHPGMMGDGTEEQNLGQTGDPAARITEAEVDEAFGQKNDNKDRPAK